MVATFRVVVDLTLFHFSIYYFIKNNQEFKKFKGEKMQLTFHANVFLHRGIVRHAVVGDGACIAAGVDEIDIPD